MSMPAERGIPATTTLPALEPEEFQQVAAALQKEISSVIVGEEEEIQGVLISLIAGGHALLEGVPGLGKTSLVRTFAQALDLDYKRIQFTPDLMPADITGTNILTEDVGGRQSLSFRPGPVFANLLLADEINRATPKTQSALLEAMQEGTVTTANATHPLPRPFCVLATENPIEMQGTYPLPEAQIDRFLLKLTFTFPARDQLTEIAFRTAQTLAPPVQRVADATMLLRMNILAHSVVMARHVVDYASRIVLALQPTAPDAPETVRRAVRYGPSPRGVQALCLAGRIVALLDGRYNLAFEDVRAIARPALCHRIVLSFDGQVQNVSTDALIDDVMARVRERAE